METVENKEEDAGSSKSRETSPAKSNEEALVGINLDKLYLAYLKYMSDSEQTILSLYDREEDKKAFSQMHKPFDRQSFERMYYEMDSDSRKDYVNSLMAGYEQERDTWAKAMAERVIEKAVRRTGRY